MGLVAVVCADEQHIYRLIQVNLKRQGWIVFRASDGAEALEHVRQQGASVLVLNEQAIRPMSQEDLLLEIGRDPGHDRVKVINLDLKAPHNPTIFGNPKGPTPPAVAIRPLEWLAKARR